MSTTNVSLCCRAEITMRTVGFQDDEVAKIVCTKCGKDCHTTPIQIETPAPPPADPTHELWKQLEQAADKQLWSIIDAFFDDIARLTGRHTMSAVPVDPETFGEAFRSFSKMSGGAVRPSTALTMCRCVVFHGIRKSFQQEYVAAFLKRVEEANVPIGKVEDTK